MPKWIKGIILFLILSFFLFFISLWNYEEEKKEYGFQVCILQKQGKIICYPETIVYEMVLTMLPPETEYKDFYDSYASLSESQKENFWKALVILCRTNLFYEWSVQNYRENLIFPVEKLCIKNNICGKDTKEGIKELQDDALSAQNATQGIIISNKNFFLPHFFLSAGTTRELITKNGKLSKKDCIQDKKNMKFVKINRFSQKRFRAKMNHLLVERDWEINDIRFLRDESGYVEKIMVKDCVVSTKDFQKEFEIDSDYFEIIRQNHQILICAKGIGHGYGLSVSYSLYLASLDKTYEEILAYFFDEIILERKYGV